MRLITDFKKPCIKLSPADIMVLTMKDADKKVLASSIKKLLKYTSKDDK